MTETSLVSLAVYRSGCVITRTAALSLPGGSQTFRFLGPGPGADPASLRLSVPEGVSGSNVQMEYLTSEEREEALKELRKKKEKNARLIAGLEEQIALWKQNGDFSGKEKISFSEMTAFLDQLPEKLEGLYSRLEALLEEQEALDTLPRVEDLNHALASQQEKLSAGETEFSFLAPSDWGQEDLAAAAHELLLRFGSVKQIQLQTLDDLSAAIGPAKAKLVYAFYHN